MKIVKNAEVVEGLFARRARDLPDYLKEIYQPNLLIFLLVIPLILHSDHLRYSHEHSSDWNSKEKGRVLMLDAYNLFHHFYPKKELLGSSWDVIIKILLNSEVHGCAVPGRITFNCISDL